MKKLVYTLLGIAVAAAGVISCDTAGGIEDFNDGVTNASLAVWVDTPFSDADTLSLLDPSNAIEFEIEFLDESNGSLVDAFQLEVSDGTNTAILISQTAFAANENGNQGFSGSFSLTDVVSALGTDLIDYVSGDEFDFTGNITRGGVVYPFGSSINAVQNFEIEIN